MEDKELLSGLKADQKDALAAVIEQYTAYVSTVVRDRLGPSYCSADVEEIAATVFFTLWQARHTIRTSHLRGWLGTVARNCARAYLRKSSKECKNVSLEDVILVDGDRAARLLEAKERRRVLRKALDELGEPDRGIFIRYYYHKESVHSIGQHLDMHPEAVKSRLRRGREKLKDILRREGYER